MSFWAFLAIGLVIMFLCMLYCGKLYHMSAWKIILSAVFVTFAGVIGAYLMGYIENGKWGFRSLYGGVFTLPLIMWISSKITRTPYRDIMDITAPAGCIMLSLMKVKCKIDGCCGGRYFLIGSENEFQFPSQIVECIVTLLLGSAMVIMITRENRKGLIYPICVLFYGLARFFLSFLRYPNPWIGPLPAGAFWSIVVIVISSIFLLSEKSRKRHLSVS